MKRNKQGFTLIELMVVTGIISLVAGVAIPNMNIANKKAHETNAKVSLKNIAKAMENYYAVNNEYPGAPSDLTTATPKYLNIDYFSSPYKGYTFTDSFTQFTYSVTAIPSNPDMTSYTMTTGGIITEN